VSNEDVCVSGVDSYCSAGRRVAGHWTPVQTGLPFPSGAAVFPSGVSTPVLQPAPLPNQWAAGIISRGIKRSRREINLSSPPLADVIRMCRTYLHVVGIKSTPSYISLLIQISVGTGIAAKVEGTVAVLIWYHWIQAHSGVPRRRGGGSTSPPEIPKGLQNRAKFNPISKRLKIVEFRTPIPPRCSEKKAVKF
jgi:hypothetical protein